MCDNDNRACLRCQTYTFKGQFIFSFPFFFFFVDYFAAVSTIYSVIRPFIHSPTHRNEYRSASISHQLRVWKRHQNTHFSFSPVHLSFFAFLALENSFRGGFRNTISTVDWTDYLVLCSFQITALFLAQSFHKASKHYCDLLSTHSQSRQSRFMR
jgi:hypothetical protein